MHLVSNLYQTAQARYGVPAAIGRRAMAILDVQHRGVTPRLMSSYGAGDADPVMRL